MCGIAGAVGKDAQVHVHQMLDVIKHRGPDGCGIFSAENVAIGNILLKITGDNPQPISNGSSVLSYNGEIYNFKHIADNLNIVTDSDSEALFALICRSGIDNAVSELDGDYAFAYYDGENLYLARDPVGVKPLFYSTGEIFAFASEKKALTETGLNDIYPLQPGHLLTYRSGKCLLKKFGSFGAGKSISDEMEASELLFKAIQEAVKKRYYTPSAISFSGGLDSSLIAALSDGAELYSVGMKGSHDMQQTVRAARSLGLTHRLHVYELIPEEVDQSLPVLMRAIESSDPQMVSIAMPLYFTSKMAKADGIRVMLSGQGADELFAGYKRYGSMDFNELSNTLQNDFENIAANNLERDDAAAMINSIELRVPYLDKKVVDLALSIIPDLKIHNGIRKYVLRLAASNVLPDELVWKEKKAAQYSSGIFSAMNKIARKKGYRGASGYLNALMHQQKT